MKSPREFRQPLQISERKVLLAFLDLALLNLALLVTLSVRLHFPLAASTVAGRTFWFVLLSAAWAVAASVAELYDLRLAARLPAGPIRAALAVVTADALYLTLPYVTPNLLPSRLTLLWFFGTTTVFVAAWRAFYALVLVQPSFRHRVVIVGAGKVGREVLAAIRKYGRTEYVPAGFVDSDPAVQGQKVDGLPVLGNYRDLPGVLEQAQVSEVVVACTGSADGDLLRSLVKCQERGATVTPVHRLLEDLTGQVPIEHADGNLHIALPLDRPPPALYDTFKRLADLLLAAVGLLATAVMTPLVAAALWLEDRGPVFYRQRRVGRGGREFVLLKFRTMVGDAESNGVQWAGINDPRVTRVGRALRRFHLDELPQAVNILRGEMSVVGPRPERPEMVTELEALIPYYRTRLSVQPGVAGWAQVNFGYADSVEDAIVKLRYDLFYIKHRSVLLDAQIIIRTVGHVFRHGGR
ncbi:MAG: exopolysaccharide biosynthesis polyprenyl glycosylphosphotransferase [bacterium]|nr:exopolysaccharide biosynthesis polyprenyl glycosylphosphotransferase [bacterium]